LAAEFGEGQFAGTVDLSLVHEGWNLKQGKWGPAAENIEARARDARVWLRNLGEQALENGLKDVEIVVVTHGGYLHYFTEDWDGHERFIGTGWANTEYRSYEFVDAERSDVNASLRETRESRERRVGEEQPLSEAEQRNLRTSAERVWSESGFQKEMESAKL
jgi:hypothetical protein